MTKKKKLLIIAICAVMVLAAGYGGYRIWCHNTYDDVLFDQLWYILEPIWQFIR